MPLSTRDMGSGGRCLATGLFFLPAAMGMDWGGGRYRLYPSPFLSYLHYLGPAWSSSFLKPGLHINHINLSSLFFWNTGRNPKYATAVNLVPLSTNVSVPRVSYHPSTYTAAGRKMYTFTVLLLWIKQLIGKQYWITHFKSILHARNCIRCMIYEYI